jgi:hypothetical protein
MTANALKTFNEGWFSKLKTRWVDIVGSVAGKELFLVDGYSLIRHILDDPLLRLAKDDCEYLSSSIRFRGIYSIAYVALFSIFSRGLSASAHCFQRRGLSP